MSDTPRPISVFLSYAPEDEASSLELQKHLSVLEHEGLMLLWHKQKPIAGTDWHKELDDHLNTATIFLLLISSDFLKQYQDSSEMQRTMERYEAEEVRIIPLLLRPVDWQGTPLGKFQSLPSNGKPITRWSRPDDAYEDITRALRKVLRDQQTSFVRMSRRQWLTRVIVAGVAGVLVGAGAGVGGSLIYSHLNSPQPLTEVRVLFVNGILPSTFDPNSLQPALEETLGSPQPSVYLEMSKTYEDAIKDFVAQKFNVLWGSDFAYVVIAKRLRDLAQPTPIPILQINHPVEKRFYYSHILTKRSNNINTLADLKGKKLAVVNKYSTSGYLYPLYNIYQIGLTTNDFTIEYAGGHLASLTHLLSGDVDACAVASEYYKSFDASNPNQMYTNQIYTDTLNEYRLTDNDILSIKRMGPLPAPPIAVQGGMSDADIWRLRQAFLLIDDGTMSALDVSGFSLVTDSVYNAVRETARKARKLGIDVEQV